MNWAQQQIGRRTGSGLLALLGFVLSPLTWWNDLVVNVPLAGAFAWVWALLDRRLFLPAFAVGYWLTNVIGLYLLHRGVSGVVQPLANVSWRRSLGLSLLYTGLVGLLVWLGWLPLPELPQ